MLICMWEIKVISKNSYYKLHSLFNAPTHHTKILTGELNVQTGEQEVFY